MKMLIRAGLAAMTLVTCQPALAEWHELFTSESGSTFSIDPERVRTVNGRRQIWVKSDHSRDAGTKARSSMTLYSIDCEKSAYRVLSSAQYDTYGKVITSGSYSDYVSGIGYDPITPETIIEGISIVACRIQ